MKRFAGLALSVLMLLSLAGVMACAKEGAKGTSLIGTWEMVDNPTKTIKISKEGDQFFYEGSQGKMPANSVDENTLLVPMKTVNVDVTVKLDPATGILTVSFMGEAYNYKKAAQG